ncbi:MAG: two pore domain potassium channel family protein [Lachnospiraceae bacterium]|nr:two pore domain potassium channel family protein [Lachnospiraceae bacterium]
MKRLRILVEILKKTGAWKILTSFIGFVFLDALLIFLIDPAVTTYGDALWYCYAVISTAGFGDVVVTRPLAKLLSVVLTGYGVLVIAIVTGVVVNFYTELIQRKKED